MTTPALPQFTPPADPPAQVEPKDEPRAKPSVTPADDWDTSTGKGGKEAVLADLHTEREKRKALETELASYRQADQDKADADKSEAEKRAAAEQRAVAAEQRALRMEVAHEKGLTPAQAKRLVGATREELAADADEILSDFAAKAPAKPAAPKPDPSQGARGEPVQPRPASLTEALKRQPQFSGTAKG